MNRGALWPSADLAGTSKGLGRASLVRGASSMRTVPKPRQVALVLRVARPVTISAVRITSLAPANAHSHSTDASQQLRARYALTPADSQSPPSYLKETFTFAR